MESFYVHCKTHGRSYGKDMPVALQRLVLMRKIDNLSLLECPTCNELAHLVFYEDNAQRDAFDTACMQWEMSSAVFLKKALNAVRLYGESARDAYLSASIPCYEA